MIKLSLKTQNIVPLSLLIIFQCALAFALALGNGEAFSEKSISPSSSVVVLVGALAGWFSFLLPAGIKNSLVFLRFSNALPGHRFIQLCESDPRIDNESMKIVIDNFLSLQMDQEKQNQYWYNKIYRPNVDNREVATAHKSYLLYRDAAAVSIIVISCLVVTSLIFPLVKAAISVGFIAVMAIFCIGFLVAANNAGKRFVTTTVAIFLIGEPKKAPERPKRKKLDKLLKGSGDESK